MRPAPSRHVERVAHRGVPSERRENTLDGFLLALDYGADAIELDVHRTRDGEVVVHHDPEVQGLEIARSKWSELRGLDLGGGAAMPRLADVLDAMGDRATIYVELKGRAIEEVVLQVCAEHGHRYALHSFDHDAMARVTRMAPDVARGILIDRNTRDPNALMSAAVDRIRPRDVWPHHSLVDEALMQHALALDVRVIVWTVNAVPEARRLVTLGVDGICTDAVQMLADL